MKMTVIFDLRSGVSGDMLLSALLDVYRNEGKDVERVLNLIEQAASVMSPTRVSMKNIERLGMKGILIDVDWNHLPENHIHGIQMMELINIGLREISANERVRKMSLRMMKNILEAEMVAHQCRTIDDVHLHETGTPDTLVDIIGISLLFDELQFDGEWVKATPLSLGSGSVDTSHGVLEVPVPAVRAMIGTIPVRAGPVEGELATPTGVAAIKSMVEIWLEHSDIGDDGMIEGKRMGTGAGKREYPTFTNMLHIWEIRK